MHPFMRTVIAILVLFAFRAVLAQSPLPAAPPGVQTTNVFGIEFSTIGDAGNRAANAAEAPAFAASQPPYAAGSVPVDFRISRTKITYTQWFQFVQAYAPYYSGPRANVQFLGFGIAPTNLDPNQPPGYVLYPGTANAAVDTTWQYAARFANWVNNGEVNQAWAFQTGAYDLSKIQRGANGQWLSLPTRMPDAKFWLPSLDEWIKAAYYDPARYGNGNAGFWMYPNGQNTPLIPGWPENGGQTDAGNLGTVIGLRVNPVAAYPTIQKSWGLFDVSGGLQEMTDTPTGYLDYFLSKGTDLQTLNPQDDRIDAVNGAVTELGGHGFRLAGTVPAPWSAGPLLLLLYRDRRRGRCHSEQTTCVQRF